MPSSGYKTVDLFMDADPAEAGQKAMRLIERARIAMDYGLFIEWLESFLGAWEETKNTDTASWAGLEEWDM